MIIPLRRARIEIVRWTREADARAHLAALSPGVSPRHVGEWHTDERVSSLVATDLEDAVLWTGLMAEGERDPWIVPTFGGLLFVSCENLLLMDDRARIVLEDGPFPEFKDVLIGDTAVWVIGWYAALRFTGTDYERFEPELGAWDEWHLEGDRLVANTWGERPEIVG